MRVQRLGNRYKVETCRGTHHWSVHLPRAALDSLRVVLDSLGNYTLPYCRLTSVLFSIDRGCSVTNTLLRGLGCK